MRNPRPNHRFYRGRWPDAEVPAGEPLWLLYEVDFALDAVTRTVDIFPDGNVTRDSIALVQRHGDDCPSLIDMPLAEGLAEAPLEAITEAEFEAWWTKGVDQPFWFSR